MKDVHSSYCATTVPVPYVTETKCENYESANTTESHDGRDGPDLRHKNTIAGNKPIQIDGTNKWSIRACQNECANK